MSFFKLPSHTTQRYLFTCLCSMPEKKRQTEMLKEYSTNLALHFCKTVKSKNMQQNLFRISTHFFFDLTPTLPINPNSTIDSSDRECHGSGKLPCSRQPQPTLTHVTSLGASHTAPSGVTKGFIEFDL